MAKQTDVQPTRKPRSLSRSQIAAAVFDFRKRAGWKQLVLALEAGVHERTIQRLEHGEKVGNDTLRAVAAAFRFDPNAFLGGFRIVECFSISDEQQCRVLLTCPRCRLDRSLRPADPRDGLVLFINSFEDWRIEYPVAAERGRMLIRRAMLGELHALETKGFTVRFGRIHRGEWNETYVIVFLNKNEDRLCNQRRLMIPVTVTTDR